MVSATAISDVLGVEGERRLVRALRRITRATDLHSSRLAARHGITLPQLTCLTHIVSNGPVSLSQLCELVLLSPSTVNGIIDRLEAKGLVVRERTDPDRRKVLHNATRAGRKLAVRVPSLLHDKLLQSVRELPPREQRSLLKALETVAILMESEGTGRIGPAAKASRRGDARDDALFHETKRSS